MEGFPRLEDVLYMDGLNLINILQICDLDIFVNFTHEKCFVFNNDGNYVLEGSRFVDNCYTLAKPHMCHHVSVNDINIWHKRLGHLNFKILSKIASLGMVRGLPNLEKKNLLVFVNHVCHSCYNIKGSGIFTDGSDGSYANSKCVF